MRDPLAGVAVLPDVDAVPAIVAAIMLAMGLALSVGSVGCEQSPEPREASVDAPATPDAQLEALRTEVDDAEKKENWVRAEVALEALMALEPGVHSAERRVRLGKIRRRRRVNDALDEVSRLLDEGAWRSAEAWLVSLEQVELHPDDQARIERLHESVDAVREEQRDAALIEGGGEPVMPVGPQ